jgi:integrase
MATVNGKHRARPPAAGLMTIAELLRELEADCLRLGRGRSTLQMVRRVCRRLVAIGIHTTADLASMDDDGFRRFMAGQPDPRSLHWGLRLVVRRASALGILEDPPVIPKASQLVIEKPAAAPAEADVDHLLEWQCKAAKDWSGYRGHVLTATAARTGLPLGDLLDLKVEDVDLDAGTITIPRRAGRKHHVNRIHPALRAILASWIPLAECHWLFPDNRGRGPWDYGRAQAWLRESARDAGVEAAGSFPALHRYFLANAVPDLPGLWKGIPARSRDLARPRHAVGPESLPVRTLTKDEVTRFMVALREDSASWEGDRVFTFYALVLFERLGAQELRNLLRKDVHLDRTEPALDRGRRRESPVVLGETTDPIVRRWLLERPDQIDSPFVFPDARGERWVAYSGIAGAVRIRRAALAAGITARVLPTDLRRFWDSCAGKVELGAAWRDGRPPAPIATGPRPKPGKPRESPDPRDRRKPDTRTDLARWHPDAADIPAVTIKGPGDPVFIRGVPMVEVPRVAFEAIKRLLAAFPATLSKATLDGACGGTAWRTALRRLREKDPAWRTALVFPRDVTEVLRKSRGYGICPW